ncbi:Protein kinase domain-containing protein [Aphelenchoides bicaudatus]|nr:Protein kinase domain-containing protein [Aphelenchoides bicaudatus]
MIWTYLVVGGEMIRACLVFTLILLGSQRGEASICPNGSPGFVPCETNENCKSAGGTCQKVIDEDQKYCCLDKKPHLANATCPNGQTSTTQCSDDDECMGQTCTYIEKHVHKYCCPSDFTKTPNTGNVYCPNGCGTSPKTTLLTTRPTTRLTTSLSSKASSTSKHDSTTIPVTFTTSSPYPQTTNKTTKGNGGGGNKNIGIYIGTIGASFLIILILVGVLFCWWYRRRSKKQRKKQINEIAEHAGDLKATDNFYDHEINDPWRVQSDCVQVNYVDKIGSGAYGDVYTGRLKGDAPIKRIYKDLPLLTNFNNCIVAIKTLPSMPDNEAINEFHKEINFMKSLRFHSHLVCLLGYVSDPVNPLMLMEYCSNGDLLQFLRALKVQLIQKSKLHEGPKTKTLVSFACQIANGMEYLSGLQLIHRDLAARNILLNKDLICKIGDFGLCRITENENQIYSSRGGKLPIRWMAIESLKTYTYSTKTDVWSYGVLLYECFGLGDVPYHEMENGQILAYLEEEKRLTMPRYCTEQIYELMLSCWQLDPSERPTFNQIYQRLKQFLEAENTHYNYLDVREIDEIEEIEDEDPVNV